MRVVVGPQGERMTLLSHPKHVVAAGAFPIAQVIPGCLYFTSIGAAAAAVAAGDSQVPKNDTKTVYVDIDSHVHYDAFYDDFGPLNLAVLFRFCQFLHALVLHHGPGSGGGQQAQQQKRIFLYTSADPKNRVNAIFLVASYMILYHHLTAEQAYLRLQAAEPPPFIGFRDASLGPPSYLLHVQHVIKSVEKASKFKWLDFAHFDADEYEHFERVENGDLNWIVPGKLLSFCGPHERSYVENGYPYHSPEVYFDYFRAHNVSTIVRLNKKIYDAKRFTDAGFAHHDLFFIDGSTPNEDIVLRFLDVVDSAKGAIAVHCKAGLGRTGCMIACWMMKHYRLTAPQCMGWLRVCRPGSVIGPQQQFLIEKHAWCWKLGKADGPKESNRIDGMESEEEVEECGKKMPKLNGVSNAERGTKARQINNGTGHQVEAGQEKNPTTDESKETVMEQETAINEAGQSQGDRLCEIKARAQLRQQNRLLQSNNSNTPPSSHFISPPVFGTEKPTATTSSSGSNTCNNICYSSATTPIKQLKLSSTIGGHAPAFVKINSNMAPHKLLASTTTTLTHCLASPTSIAGSAQQQNGHPDHHHQQREHLTTTPGASGISNNNNNYNCRHIDISTAIHLQQKSPIAVINRLPIQKVSVSSTSNQHTLQQNASTPSRIQMHRKHLAAASRLKPYQSSEYEKASPSCTSAAAVSAHRFASELATTTQSSAQNNFSKSLKKQFNAISARQQQQQKRHKQHQQHQLMAINNNNNNGTMPWASPMDGGGPLAHNNGNNNNNNNNNNGCKYELRPRDQLHLPVRFASEQPPVMGGGAGGAASVHKNTNGTGTSMPTSNQSPYLLTRHQKTSKSATAFFPTSSHL